MAFVRGHWRALGWVRSHRRSPDRPSDAQLTLPAAASATPSPVLIPAQRRPVDLPAAASASVRR